MFSLDPSDFLRADLTQTRIEQLAEEVLSGLHNLRRDDDNVSASTVEMESADEELGLILTLGDRLKREPSSSRRMISVLWW